MRVFNDTKKAESSVEFRLKIISVYAKIIIGCSWEPHG